MYKDQPPLKITGGLIDPNVQAVIQEIVDYINAEDPAAKKAASAPEPEPAPELPEEDDNGRKSPSHRRR